MGGALFLLVFLLEIFFFFFDRAIAVLFSLLFISLFHLGSFANIAFCHGIIGHR